MLPGYRPKLNGNPKKLQRALNKYNKLSQAKHVTLLKGLWLPDALLGAAMIGIGIVVLGVMAGWISSPEKIIGKERTFSYFFSIGLIAAGIDAISCSWRMGTYNKRKREDRAFVETLHNHLLKA